MNELNWKSSEVITRMYAASVAIFPSNLQIKKNVELK